MSVETFLTANVMSLDEVMDAIRAQSLDETSRPVFSDRQIKLAIRHAIVRTRGRFYTTDTYTFDFTGGTLSYTLPRYVQRIITLGRERTTSVFAISNTLTGVADEEIGFRHFRNRTTNTLVLTRDYPSGSMTVWYQRDVQIPIDNRQNNGSHSSAVTTLTLTDNSPKLYLAQLPAWFKWEDEIIKMTAASSNTSATIARGAFGSIAAAHATAKTLSQIIACDADGFYDYLFTVAGQKLNEWRVQQGSEAISVAANVTVSRMFKEEAQDMRGELRQGSRTRRMSFRRTRRPRRNVN